MSDCLENKSSKVLAGPRPVDNPDEPETFSPELLAWLEFIARDHIERPEQIKPFTTAMRDRALLLTHGLDIDLDSKLPID